MARRLLAMGLTPNALTMLGGALTVAAGGFFMAGAGHAAPWEAGRLDAPTSWIPILGAVTLTIASFLDVFDGAVARLGNLSSRFGAVLDSTVDRLSDWAIFGSCAGYFFWRHNLTMGLLSLTALLAAYVISYVRARAENVVDDCEVGFWQRPERCVVFFFAAFVAHIPAAIWLLGTFPLVTAAHRLLHTRRLTLDLDARPGIRWPWRHPRGSIGYLLFFGALLGFIVAAPHVHPIFAGRIDPLAFAAALLFGE